MVAMIGGVVSAAPKDVVVAFGAWSPPESWPGVRFLMRLVVVAAGGSSVVVVTRSGLDSLFTAMVVVGLGGAAVVLGGTVVLVPSWRRVSSSE